SRRSWRGAAKTKRRRKGGGGATKKAIATNSRGGAGGKKRHGGGGRGGARGMYPATVRSAISSPGRAGSARVGRRPQVGFSRAMRRIRWRSSASSFGRPTALPLECHRQ